MPCQVSWQFVATKSQRLVHSLGEAEAVVGIISAAHASTSHKAPADASIVAAKMPSFAMQAPRFAIDELWLGDDSSTSRCRPHVRSWQGNPDLCGCHAT